MKAVKIFLKNLTKIILFFLFLLAIIYTLNYITHNFFSSTGIYPVTAVFDGDTIEVLMDSKKQKVRLIGVDTPETGGHDTPVECYGPEATTFTRSILIGEEVKLEAGNLSTNRDRYDRLLRYVIRARDGYDVNLELLKQGYSPAYEVFPNERQQEFASAAASARANNLGIWQHCN